VPLLRLGLVNLPTQQKARVDERRFEAMDLAAREAYQRDAAAFIYAHYSHRKRLGSLTVTTTSSTSPDVSDMRMSRTWSRAEMESWQASSHSEVVS